jgi:hypothetical protein
MLDSLVPFPIYGIFIVLTRVVDPYSFFPDPDPDPEFDVGD